MKLKKNIVLGFIMLLIFMGVVGSSAVSVKAATKLNKESITLNVGELSKLKVKGNSRKVKWSSSKASVAKVTSKGLVIARKKGTAKIVAKVGSKKYVCKVKVKPATVKVQKSNLKKLKKYIENNGFENQNGGTTISYDHDDYAFFIAYDPYENALRFGSLEESSDCESSLLLYLDSPTKKAKIKYAMIMNDIPAMATAEVKLNKCKPGKVNFDIETIPFVKESLVNDMANTYLELSMIGWNIILEDANLSLPAIGIPYARTK